MKLYLVPIKNRTIFEQLQLEEALLRADKRNFCVVQDGVAPSIVTGISGTPDHLNLNLLQQAPVPVIKRFSGGGTVFVDPNTCFVSFICQAAETVPALPDPVFCWSEKLYGSVFSGLPFSLKERDYIFRDRKFGGNAQYMRKERWLHHSTFLWQYEPEKMEYLTLPKRRPDYRQDRPHKDFLCSMSEYLPSRKAFWERLLTELDKRFDLIEMPEEEVVQVLQEPHRKAASLMQFD